MRHSVALKQFSRNLVKGGAMSPRAAFRVWYSAVRKAMLDAGGNITTPFYHDGLAIRFHSDSTLPEHNGLRRFEPLTNLPLNFKPVPWVHIPPRALLFTLLNDARQATGKDYRRKALYGIRDMRRDRSTRAAYNRIP